MRAVALAIPAAALPLSAGALLLTGCAVVLSGSSPGASSAHAHGRPGRSLAGAARMPAGVPMPNRKLTPGSVQSRDTAAICTPGWAGSHRHVSFATKDRVAAEYGLSSHDGYEIDHLIPLELGGSNAISNLWPQPYNSPHGANQKDGLEDYLHEQVCYHGLPLATAQREIATNWYAAWIAAGRPTPQEFGYSTGPRSAVPGGGPATCRVRAVYNARHQDYDVYVRSNRPDQLVTVTTSGGARASWHTDSAGYADVYLHVGRAAAGQTATARVGGASCTATLG